MPADMLDGKPMYVSPLDELVKKRQKRERMVCTVLTLPPKLVCRLDEEALRLGISRSEVVRRIIDAYFERKGIA